MSDYQNGLDSPVGIAFKVEYEGNIKTNQEASKIGWFKKLPDNMHADQGEFIETEVLG